MPLQPAAAASTIRALFDRTRAQTEALTAPLEIEDMVAQSMPDASPVKWHLAHTTWFFEEFILRQHDAAYQSPDDRFAYLFNSYYVQAGPRYERASRGLISRPTVREVMAYRAGVTDAILRMVDAGAAPLDLVELGCHHEMQHQELLLTDLLHLLSHNPLWPAYKAPSPNALASPAALEWISCPGGIHEIGHDGSMISHLIAKRPGIQHCCSLIIWPVGPSRTPNGSPSSKMADTKRLRSGSPMDGARLSAKAGLRRSTGKTMKANSASLSACAASNP